MHTAQQLQFSQICTHKQHPIPRPYGRDVGCLLWVIWRKWPWYIETALYQIGSTRVETSILNFQTSSQISSMYAYIYWCQEMCVRKISVPDQDSDCSLIIAYAECRRETPSKVLKYVVTNIVSKQKVLFCMRNGRKTLYQISTKLNFVYTL